MLELLFIVFVDASLMNLWDSERLQRDEAIQRKRVPVMMQEAVWLEAGCSKRPTALGAGCSSRQAGSGRKGKCSNQHGRI